MSTETVSRNGQKVQTPLKALRAKCIDCSGGSRSEVKHCPVTDCPLYPFRTRFWRSTSRCFPERPCDFYSRMIRALERPSWLGSISAN